MKKLILILSLFGTYLSSQGINYFVSDISGNDSNDGLSIATAFKTIQKAADLTFPGDTVFVLNGTYTNLCPECNVVTISRSGTQSAWIVYINYPNNTPLVQFNGWQGFQLKDGAGYIEINGFTICGNSANVTFDSALNQPGGCNNPDGPIDPKYNGNGIQTYGLSSSSSGYPHHVRIVNNSIYNCCGAGVSSFQSDYLTIEKNIIYNNGWYTIFGYSGITLYQNWNFDNDTTNDRMIICDNRIFGNMNFVPWLGACAILDGNGIIVDDSKNTQNGSTIGPYHGKTYITNNLVYGSGGAGIHTYSSEHIRIVNNSVYFNQLTPDLDKGEIDAQSSNDVIIRNNIFYAQTNRPINTNWNNTNVILDYNLYYGGNGSSVHGSNTITADPKFLNPLLTIDADFQVNSGSPAIDNGSALLAPDVDFRGVTRPIGNGYDIGAYESNYTGVQFLNASKSAIFEQNYPNPAEGFTTITFKLPESEPVSLKIFDVFGNEMISFPTKRYDAGEYMVLLHTQSLPAGSYVIRLQASDKVESKKMIVK
jgi:parallel beta-helix repeat protein